MSSKKANPIIVFLSVLLIGVLFLYFGEQVLIFISGAICVILGALSPFLNFNPGLQQPHNSSAYKQQEPGEYKKYALPEPMQYNSAKHKQWMPKCEKRAVKST